VVWLGAQQQLGLTTAGGWIMLGVTTTTATTTTAAAAATAATGTSADADTQPA